MSLSSADWRAMTLGGEAEFGLRVLALLLFGCSATYQPSFFAAQR